MHRSLLWRMANSSSAIYNQVEKAKKARWLSCAIFTAIVALLHYCFGKLLMLADKDSNQHVGISQKAL